MQSRSRFWRSAKLGPEFHLEIDIRADRHFLCSAAVFDDYAHKHRGLILWTFYRNELRRLGILIEDGELVEFRCRDRAKLPKTR